MQQSLHNDEAGYADILEQVRDGDFEKQLHERLALAEKDKLDQLRQSLHVQDVELEINVNPNMHDREIKLDNGWVIKIGRGLDFYQRPGSWFEIGSLDMSLRKCLETKVDIFRA